MSQDALPLRPLGGTGLRVPPLCIGCAALGDMPDTFAYGVAEDQALATARAIFAGPVRFADTAAAYGDGESERRLGLVLREIGGPPDDFVLATKADRDLATGVFDGAQVRRSVERSLRLLGVDRLQICYLHDPETIGFETAMAPDGPVAALHALRDAGVIEHIGVAGGPVDLMMRFVGTGAFALAINHNHFTLLDRTADPLWDLCARHGVAALNAAPYGSGILAKGPGSYPRYAYRDAPPDFLRRAFALEDLCRRHDVPLAALALQYSLRDQRLTSTIVGISNPERLEQTIRLARQPLPEELWDEVTRFLDAETKVRAD